MVMVLLIAALILFIIGAWLAGANTWARIMSVAFALLTLTQLAGVIPGIS